MGSATFTRLASSLLVAAASGCASPGGSGTAVPEVDSGASDSAAADTHGDILGDSDSGASDGGDSQAPDTTPASDATSAPDGCSGDTCPPTQCVAGATTCAANGAGWEGCGLDADDVMGFGRYVPCVPGRACAAGRCLNATCRAAEVMLVVDRSSSMLVGDTWDWTLAGIDAVVRDYEYGNLLGLRQFPFGDACGVGEIIPLAPRQQDLVDNLTPPEATAATPLAASLTGLEQAFGDPNDGEAIVLLTDGDETCGTPDDAIAAASRMLHRGVHVHVIAVTTTANQELLDRIAAHGGTGKSRLVTTQAELEEALAAVLTAVDACRECSAEDGLPRCDGDIQVRCGEVNDVVREDCGESGAVCDAAARRCALPEGATCGGEASELACASALVCHAGACCERACQGRVCGDDGCGGSCGTCQFGDCVDGRCVCEPDCQGRVCGDDGCGGSCGSCTQADYVCNDFSGQCVYDDPCNGIAYEGCCGLLGQTLTYCDNGVLKTVECGADVCGWSGEAGYDCIGFPASDPAGQFPYSCP